MFTLGWRKLIYSHVLLSLYSGRAFRGDLLSKRGRLLTLKNVMMFDPEGHEGIDGVAMDGEVVVDTLDVEFIQILRPGR